MNNKLKNFKFIPDNFNINDKYEFKKLEFINEQYSNDNTQKTFWYLYKKLVHDIECKSKKDVSKFSLSEMESLIRSFNVAITTKRNTLNFIQKYNEWCVVNNITEENSLENIKLERMLSAPDVNRNINYISFEELYKNCMWLESDPDTDIIMLDVLIALLMRSGLKATEIVDMRYSDVNYKNGCVEFESDGKIIKRHLKKFVLKALNEVKETVYLVGASKRPLLIIDDHVVKTLDPAYDKEKMYKNIRKRMSKFKTHYRSLNENILITSLKIDDLLEIKNEKGSLKISDYKDIQVKYGNSPSSYQKIREDYLQYLNQIDCKK